MHCKQKGALVKILLSLLERRLDNTLYRLKFATTRRKRVKSLCMAVMVNGEKSTPIII